MIPSEPPELQNPYAPTSEFRVYPESISFNGVIIEEHYRKLLPKNEMRFFVTLAFLLFAIALPILITASVVSIFIGGQPGPIIGSLTVSLLLCAAMMFCIRMASTRIRAKSYLKKFPDLLGAMKGTFSSKGLILEDMEKSHWFPWVQLSRLVVTDGGVRVPLGDDPRRFLALADELFDGYRPSDMEQMLFRNKVAQTTYDQLAADSATVFQSEIGAVSYYSGWLNQPTKWTTWIAWLLSPASVCVFIVIQTLQAEWDWFWTILVILTVLGTLSSIRPLVQLVRNRGRTVVMYWGWLDETELIHGSGVHVMKIPISSMKYIGRDAEVLQFVLASGTSLYVFRSLFRDANYFDQISASFDRFNA